MAGWLVNADGSDTSAFEPSASVIHMTAASNESSTPQLSPIQLTQNETITNRLAGVADHPLKVLRFGNITIVSGSYATPEQTCGRAWFTLRSRSDSWRILHLRLQDVGGTCQAE